MSKKPSYPNIDMKQTAIRIKHIIESKGYTPTMIQEHLHLSCVQPIYRWYKGESIPTIEKLIYLAGLYEVSLDELVGRIVVDKYAKVKEYIKEFAAEDIPVDDEDDISSRCRVKIIFIPSGFPYIEINSCV